MSDQDFEQRLQRLLRNDSEQGVRPVDPTAVAHAAATPPEKRGWLSALGGSRFVLVAGLAAIGAVAALALGSRLLVVPAPTATPGPSATAVAQSPVTSSSAVESASPTPTASPSVGPTPTLTLTPSPTPTTTPAPSASATPKPTPSTVPVPTANPTGWVELAGFPTYGADTHVSAVAYGAGKFVAVGWSTRNGKMQGRIWTSTDGLAWQAQTQTTFAGRRLTSVTYNGQSFFAFGSPNTLIWSSLDGVAWSQLEMPPSSCGELGCLNIFDGSYIADATSVGFDVYGAGETTVTGGDIACSETCVAVWRESNGDWTQSVIVDGDSYKTFAAIPGLDVVVTYGSFIGKGVWYSTDFQDWTHPDPVPAEDVGFLDATSDGSRIVLVGYGSTPVDDYGRATALTTTDGQSWSTVTIDGTSGSPAEQVTWAGSKFVAIGAQRRTPGFSWWSADGLAWVRGPDVPFPPADPLPPEAGDDPFVQRTFGGGDPGFVLAQTYNNGLHVWFAPVGAFK